MSKKEQVRQRGQYTLEFKLEAVRLGKGGQEAAVTARVLNVPKQTLGNCIRLPAKGELQGAGDKPVSAEQMELARLRAELARVKMARDILKKRRAGTRKHLGMLSRRARTSQRNCCEVRLDRASRR
jgi:transposase-like protein